MAPHHIPNRLPAPASTMAASSSIERVSGNSPVLTTPVDKPRKAPARPAQAALTTNAITLVRAT